MGIETQTAVSLAAHALLLLGFFFIFTGVLGILRLPDFYTRLHAMGKCDTLGVALMVLGVAMLTDATIQSIKILLIIVFVFLANATSTHALGRAALRAGLKPWTRDDTAEEST